MCIGQSSVGQFAKDAELPKNGRHLAGVFSILDSVSSAFIIFIFAATSGFHRIERIASSLSGRIPCFYPQLIDDRLFK